MANVLKILKDNQHNYILAVLLAVFIIFDVRVPDAVAELVDTIIGKVIVVVAALNLFMLHPVVGALGIIAAYELIKRSEQSPQSQEKKYAPSEKKKSLELNKLNQFPVTVEEEVIAKQIPYSFNVKAPTRASYRPVQDPVFDAAKISN